MKDMMDIFPYMDREDIKKMAARKRELKAMGPEAELEELQKELEEGTRTREQWLEGLARKVKHIINQP